MENLEKKAAYCYNTAEWLSYMLAALLLYAAHLQLPPDYVANGWLLVFPLLILLTVIEKTTDFPKRYLLKKGLPPNDIAAGKAVFLKNARGFNLSYFIITAFLAFPLLFLLKKWNTRLADANHAVANILFVIGMLVILGSSAYLANRINLHRHYRPKSDFST